MKLFKNILFISLFALGLGFFGVAHASDAYTDTFDTYANGNLDGQGSWVAGSGHLQVVSSGCYSGHHCYTNSTSADTATVAFTTDNNGSGSGSGITGTEKGWFKIHSLPSSGQTTKILELCYHFGCPANLYIDSAGDLYTVNRAYTSTYLKHSVPLDTWFKISATWQNDSTSAPYNYFTFQYNNEAVEGNHTMQVFGASYNVYYFKTGSTSGGTAGVFFGDNYGDASFSSPPATVSFTSPTNGSTQTLNTTNLSISYGNLNPALYESIRINFHYVQNGVDTVSTGYNYYPITTSSGSFSVPLSAFDFDFNGDWTATAVAIIKAPQLSDFLQTENLADPVNYHLIINFGSLTAPFTFSNWNTWYTANSAGGYSASSDFGNAFVGFFQPIFENAFRFANAVLQYFDINQANAQGERLGGALPIADAYVSKLDVFFGGFPLMTLFKFTLIILLAIFVIRTVFKFIPFFG